MLPAGLLALLRQWWRAGRQLGVMHPDGWLFPGQQILTLSTDEFIRRFPFNVLPKGFHRIRRYGLLAGSTRKARLDHVRRLLGVLPPAAVVAPSEPHDAAAMLMLRRAYDRHRGVPVSAARIRA